MIHPAGVNTGIEPRLPAPGPAMPLLSSLLPSQLVIDMARIELLVAEHEPSLLPAWKVAAKVTRRIAKKKQRKSLNDAAKQLRDHYLGEASDFLIEEKIKQKAHKMSEIILAYKAKGWPQHVKRTVMPPDIIGTMDEYLWRAFKVGTYVPASPRQLNTIIKNPQCNALKLTIAPDRPA